MSIGIAGFGFVGQAVYGSIRGASRNWVHIYDPGRGLCNKNLLKECEIIFCCLPTPQKLLDGSQDFSYYDKFFNEDIDTSYKGILVIKSTVLYSNISKYLDKYNIVINPEFLNQNSAVSDFKNQKIIILGGLINNCTNVQLCYENTFYFNNKISYEFCTHKEAIAAKYMHNIYHAYKVLFWNYVHGTCGNHRKVFDLYSKITGNTFEMSNICADGTPGFGGSCFPKDVAAFNLEYPNKLTDFIIEYNKQLRQG